MEERKGEDTYDYEEFVELLKNMEFYKSKKLDIFSQTVCKAWKWTAILVLNELSYIYSQK